MKEDNIKKAFQASTKHKAPEGFTSGVMSKIEAGQTSRHGLLPKWMLWAMGILLSLCTLAILITMPSTELPFSLQAITQGLADIISAMILPFTVVSLLFIQSILRTRQTVGKIGLQRGLVFPVIAKFSLITSYLQRSGQKKNKHLLFAIRNKLIFAVRIFSQFCFWAKIKLKINNL